MKVIGITGTSGSGKSTVCGWLTAWGYPVLDGDAISREIAVPGSQYLQKLVQVFGPQICDDQGRLLRRQLGERIFADPDAHRQLTEITTPLILEELRRRLELLEQQGNTLAFLDGALIIDTPFAPLCDMIVAVVGDRENQISRIMQRDGVSRSAAQDRLDRQVSNAFLHERADLVLENTGTLDQLRQKTEQFLERIKGTDP